MSLPYSVQWSLTFALMIISAMIGVIAVTQPEALGITPVLKNWLIIVNVGIAQALGLLPRIQRPPNPERAGKD